MPTIEQAMQFHRAGRLVEAEHVYRQIVKDQPRVPKLLEAMGENAEEDAPKGMIATRNKRRDRSESHADEKPLSKSEWDQIFDSLTSDARETVGKMIRGLWDDTCRDAAVILASFDV